MQPGPSCPPASQRPTTSTSPEPSGLPGCVLPGSTPLDQPTADRMAILDMVRAQDPTIAGFVRAHRDEILRIWQRRVRALATARRVPGSLLRASVPEMIERVAAYLEARADRAQVAEPGERHGAARLEEGFDLDDALLEISVLRDAVLEVRAAAGALRGELAIVLVRAFDPIVAAVAHQYSHR